MAKIAFQKPSTTVEQQIAILKNRGMHFQTETAKHILQHVNYYRLSAYWLPFEKDHTAHTFQSHTTFEQVTNLYFFDQKLRNHILSAITDIEISIRSQWVNQLSLHYGSHAHLNEILFTSKTEWTNNLKKLVDELSRAKENFIEHFRQNYIEQTPPIWVSSEIMSLGLFSRFYASLKPMALRSDISKTYGLDESVLESWLRSLTFLRNKCAHHARVWNCELTITPKHPKKVIQIAAQWQNSRCIYNTLLLISYLHEIIIKNSNWKKSLCTLIQSYNVDTAAMGFPSYWKQNPFWQ